MDPICRAFPKAPCDFSQSGTKFTAGGFAFGVGLRKQPNRSFDPKNKKLFSKLLNRLENVEKGEWPLKLLAYCTTKHPPEAAPQVPSNIALTS